MIGERKAMEENFKGQCGWGGRLRAPAREEDGVGSEGGRRRGARDEEEAGSQNMKGNAAGGSTSLGRAGHVGLGLTEKPIRRCQASPEAAAVRRGPGSGRRRRPGGGMIQLVGGGGQGYLRWPRSWRTPESERELR